MAIPRSTPTATGAGYQLELDEPCGAASNAIAHQRWRRLPRDSSDSVSADRQGDDRNRTGVNGFAGRCVATPPRRQGGTKPSAQHGLSIEAARRAALDPLIRFLAPNDQFWGD